MHPMFVGVILVYEWFYCVNIYNSTYRKGTLPLSVIMFSLYYLTIVEFTFP